MPVSMSLLGIVVLPLSVSTLQQSAVEFTNHASIPCATTILVSSSAGEYWDEFERAFRDMDIKKVQSVQAKWTSGTTERKISDFIAGIVTRDFNKSGALMWVAGNFPAQSAPQRTLRKVIKGIDDGSIKDVATAPSGNDGVFSELFALNNPPKELIEQAISLVRMLRTQQRLLELSLESESRNAFCKVPTDGSLEIGYREYPATRLGNPNIMVEVNARLETWGSTFAGYLIVVGVDGNNILIKADTFSAVEFKRIRAGAPVSAPAPPAKSSKPLFVVIGNAYNSNLGAFGITHASSPLDGIIFVYRNRVKRQAAYMVEPYPRNELTSGLNPAIVSLRNRYAAKLGAMYSSAPGQDALDDLLAQVIQHESYHHLVRGRGIPAGAEACKEFFLTERTLGFLRPMEMQQPSSLGAEELLAALHNVREVIATREPRRVLAMVVTEINNLLGVARKDLLVDRMETLACIVALAGMSEDGTARMAAMADNVEKAESIVLDYLRGFEDRVLLPEVAKYMKRMGDIEVARISAAKEFVLTYKRRLRARSDAKLRYSTGERRVEEDAWLLVLRQMEKDQAPELEKLRKRVMTDDPQRLQEAIVEQLGLRSGSRRAMQESLLEHIRQQ